MERELYASCLKQIVREFELDATTSARNLRKILAMHPLTFYSAALPILAERGESQGLRYLAVLVRNAPDLYIRILDPYEFSRDQAIALAGRLSRSDPNFAVALTRYVSSKEHGNLGGSRAMRALDVLGAIPNVSLPHALSQLVYGQDAEVASKAALTVGRKNQNVSWAKSVIESSPDARVRANAVESIWGKDSTEARGLLWYCRNDSNNRVAGNAIIGLQLLGDRRVPELLRHMAGHASSDHRLTAAWAYGRIADPGLMNDLAPLLEDAHSAVRRVAKGSWESLERIQASELAIIGQAEPVPAIPAVVEPVELKGSENPQVFSFGLWVDGVRVGS